MFVPDQITHDFVQKRRLARHKSIKTYFQPDEDAEYAATHEIDLGNVSSFLAKYPKPDDVVPVNDHDGMELNGCFIGACTTAEEDLILGALVLEQGLQRGQVPVKKGKRKVVPGSLPILHKLRELGLADVYEAAGFEIGIPGCSYCVGMSADQAAPGEVWLSSQNRNFENRMGKGMSHIQCFIHCTNFRKGSIGHLSSAATVAASSLEMKLRDPHELLAAINLDRWNEMRGNAKKVKSGDTRAGLEYVEPSGSVSASSGPEQGDVLDQPTTLIQNQQPAKFAKGEILKGKVQVLGDFIDTDAVCPY